MNFSLPFIRLIGAQCQKYRKLLTEANKKINNSDDIYFTVILNRDVSMDSTSDKVTKHSRLFVDSLCVQNKYALLLRYIEQLVFLIPPTELLQVPTRYFVHVSQRHYDPKTNKNEPS